MSANDQTTAHEEDHSGPIKTPQQLLLAIFFSFVIPIFAIIGLVYYVASDNRPAAGADNEKAVAERIQKIGMVDIRDANRALKAGSEVYAAQCAACHTAGVAGAPKFGDAAAWAPRIKTGYEALLTSSLKGKGAMGPQGGGDFDDVEIGRAVAHMANAAGAKFAEPQRAAAVAAAPDSAAPAAATAAPSADVMAAVAAANKAAAAPAAAPAAAAGAVPALYTQACAACHVAGVANAPKLGDKAGWAPRLALGVDGLTASVIKGKGAMPPRGGSTGSDADIKAVVQYMVSTVK